MIVTLRPSDILHIPGLGFDGLVGYSPIAMARNAIGLAMATEEYGAKFFANGAAPGSISQLEYHQSKQSFWKQESFRSMKSLEFSVCLPTW